MGCPAECLDAGQFYGTTTPSPSCSSPTAHTWPTSVRLTTSRVTSDERDRELPRAGVALAVHGVVTRYHR